MAKLRRFGRPKELRAIAQALPPGHPYPRKLMMLLGGIAILQRENGLTPEGLDEAYKKMDAEKTKPNE